jgi:hypothetical protein
MDQQRTRWFGVGLLRTAKKSRKMSDPFPITGYLIVVRVTIIFWTHLAVFPVEIVFDAIEVELEHRAVRPLRRPATVGTRNERLRIAASSRDESQNQQRAHANLENLVGSAHS